MTGITMVMRLCDRYYRGYEVNQKWLMGYTEIGVVIGSVLMKTK